MANTTTQISKLTGSTRSVSDTQHPLEVILVDSNGTDITVTSEAQYTEDAAPVAGGTTTNPLNVSFSGALDAGDNNIGNVDIVTVPAPLSTTGGGTEATALRVTVASDSTGLVSVDDNGGALTVDWAGAAPPIGAG